MLNVNLKCTFPLFQTSFLKASQQKILTQGWVKLGEILEMTTWKLIFQNSNRPGVVVQRNLYFFLASSIEDDFL